MGFCTCGHTPLDKMVWQHLSNRLIKTCLEDPSLPLTHTTFALQSNPHCSESVDDGRPLGWPNNIIILPSNQNQDTNDKHYEAKEISRPKPSSLLHFGRGN